MDSETVASKPRITRVLTISFISLVLLTLCAFVIALISHQALRREQGWLLDSRLPAQLAAQELADHAYDLTLYEQQVFLARNAESLKDIRAAIESEVDYLRGLLGSDANGASAILEQAAEDAFRALQAQEQHILAVQALADAIDNTLRGLEDLRFSLLRDQEYSRANEMAWAQVKATVNGWPAVFLTLQGGPEPEAAELQKSAIRSEIREVSREYTRLRNREAATSTGQMLLAILDATYLTTGPFGRYQTVVDTRNQSIEALNEAQASSARLYEWSKTRQQTLDDDTSQRITSLQTLTLRAEWLLLALGIITIGLGAFLIQRFVYRGLSQPLNHLADKTARLARGDQIQIGEAQYEEFDRIEQGLSVFASNALQLRQTTNDLSEKNLQLQRSIEDLQGFAYAASHDLRTPLHAIRSICHILEEDLLDTSAPDAEHRLKQINQRIDGMQRLLDDLLNYTLATEEQENDRDTLELHKLFTSQLADVEHNHLAQLQCEFSCHELHAPRRVWEQIAFSLLDNAIRHHPATPAHVDMEDHFLPNIRPIKIRVGSRLNTYGDYCVIFVEDNGNGIRPEYHEQVTQLFTTIVPKSERFSSGLGLALVTKLLGHYGAELALHPGSADAGLRVEISWPLHRDAEALLDPYQRGKQCPNQ